MKVRLLITLVITIIRAQGFYAQNFVYDDIHITGTSKLTGIKYEHTYTLSKTEGDWCKNARYIIKIPKFYTRYLLYNTLYNYGYTVTTSSSNVLRSVTEITDPTFGNEFLVIEMQVVSESVGNSFSVTVSYDLESSLNMNRFDPTDLLPLTVPANIKNLYTARTDWVDSDNANIINKAKEITTGISLQIWTVQALAEWIKSNISYKEITEANHKASIVLNKREGDCDGQANLMIAFCRSLGIPARLSTGYSIKMERKYPTKNNYAVFGQGMTGSEAPGLHANYEIYYPTVSSWIAGDPAMSTLHFSHVTNLMEGHGKDINWQKDAGCKFHRPNFTYDPATETPTQQVSYTIANPPKITSSITNLTSDFKYIYDNQFFGSLDKGSSNALISSSDQDLPVGPYDRVKIEDPPSSLQLPPNTLTVTPGTQASYYAKFTSGMGGTSAVSYDWTITLYYDGGTYTYAQGLSQPDKGDYSVWRPTLSASLPNYNWIMDPSGNIYGEVKVFVHISDGYIENDRTSIGAVCAQNLQNITYTTSQTITGCRISATNVTIQNNCNVIFDAGETTLNGPFEVKQGSAFEAK